MTDLPQILNWRRWSDQITLSGQPTEAQLVALCESGVTHVVNLGPHDNKGALDDEAGSVAAIGVEYVYIPVDFEAPTDADFETFCAVLSELDGQRIHVHCIYNARVSAFMYRYSKAGLGGDSSTALALMDSIWRPGRVWAAFIGDHDSLEEANRYAGEDY